jgi:hypothetical protein
MIKKLVSILDIYGQPIGVNYKGESTYKTKVGALMSLITFGLGLALAGSKIQQMVDKDNSNIQQLTNTLDLFSGTFSFNLANQKLELVAGLRDRNSDLVKIPPEMGSISLF